MEQTKANDGNTVVALYNATTQLPEVRVHDEEVQLLHEEKERYKTVKMLGEGGAGYVDLVADQDIQRAVARKTAKSTTQDENLIRFVEEVRVLGQLEHPNIVPIHDVGISSSGEYFFTMKYVEGESLREIITKLQNCDAEYHKIYTFERRMSIFLEILHAVHFAHDQGFIHRDIKPDNIMIGRYGEVLLMDWGIAKKIRDARSHLLDNILKKGAESFTGSKEQRVFETQHGTIIGTPAYMAPEQILNDRDVDERTDIYSLSILLHEFLTLHHYLDDFDGNVSQMLLAAVHRDPVRAEDLSHPGQGAVPREHCFLMRRGYKKDPKERFQSVGEMIEVLRSNLQGQIKVSCPSTFLKHHTYRFGRFLDNHRKMSVVVSAVVFVLALMGVVQGINWIRMLL
ncbi:MAG: serine/threonine protein kinase [Deltaproteobacteria bacterium]|nr:MAG: serine/threonine protein kinase [Deltaproteobacteria bacterium]